MTEEMEERLEEVKERMGQEISELEKRVASAEKNDKSEVSSLVESQPDDEPSPVKEDSPEVNPAKEDSPEVNEEVKSPEKELLPDQEREEEQDLRMKELEDKIKALNLENQ